MEEALDMSFDRLLMMMMMMMIPCKVKVKYTGHTAHRGSRGIAILFLDHDSRRGEWSDSRPGRSLPSGKNRYTFYRRLGGSQGRSGQVRRIAPLPGFDPQTVQPVAQSLYRLSYAAHMIPCSLAGIYRRFR